MRELVSAFLQRQEAHAAATAGLPPQSVMAARNEFERAAYEPLAHAMRGVSRDALVALGANLPLRPGAVPNPTLISRPSHHSSQPKCNLPRSLLPCLA